MAWIDEIILDHCLSQSYSYTSCGTWKETFNMVTKISLTASHKWPFYMLSMVITLFDCGSSGKYLDLITFSQLKLDSFRV